MIKFIVTITETDPKTGGFELSTDVVGADGKSNATEMKIAKMFQQLLTEYFSNSLDCEAAR